MPNRIIFTSKTKKASDSGKIPSSVDVLVQTDDSPNMDDFRTWASDTSAIISLNRTLQNEGIGNTGSGAQYFNRYGSATLFQTKLIPNTDYTGRTVAAQGDNRSWIRKDYIENYKITCRGALNKSSTIFAVNLSGVQQTERLYTVTVPTSGGLAGTEPPQSNVLGSPPQLPGIFDGSYLRKLTTVSGNTIGSSSITVTSIYGNSVASFGIIAGSRISGTGIPDNTFVGSSYSPGSVTIPLVDSQGNPVNLTTNCQNEIVYLESEVEAQGVPHYNTPANGTGARFAVYVNEDSVIEEVIVVNPGTGYSSSNQTTVNKLIIPGSFVGGDDGDNDITITSYTLNTYAILITSTDFIEKNVNIGDTVSSEDTGIDTFTYTGTAAGTITKQATMTKDQTFITVTNASLIQKGMTVTSSTGFGIPQNTIVGDSYVSGSTTVPLTTVNGVTPQKVTLTYSTPINVSFAYAATFTNVSGTTIVGSGSGATFIVTKNTNNTYNVYPSSTGSSYTPGAQIRILGSRIGGVNGTNDLIITVQKVLDKFPAGTRVTFFEKSATNPGYYDLYLSSVPRTGVSLSKTTTSTGNLAGQNFITVTDGSSISSGMQISATGGIPSGTYVGNGYVSGSTQVPLTELDGSTEIVLSANTQSTALTFSAPTLLENGDGLVFYRSSNSFWSQLNSGSVFQGRPVNFLGWYRNTRFNVRNVPATLLPPSNENNKYRLYTQRFRVDTLVNLNTGIVINSDWSLYIQVGFNQDPKWETLIIVSTDLESTYVGSDGKTHYVFQIVTQYPSKFSWDLSTEQISYCYIYRNILGGIDSSYIVQSVPFNKAYLSSEYVWIAPKITTIPVTNIPGKTEGGIFRMNSINDTPSTTFRIVDKDTYSMYVRTWKDLVIDSTPDPLGVDQVRLKSSAQDPYYIYASPRTVGFRAPVNSNVYVNVDTGTLFLGSSPATNSNINYTNNIVRLDTSINYAPSNPLIWTDTFGRQYLYYQEYSWNYYVDNLTASTSNGNPSSLSVPYKFVSTNPYLHSCQIKGNGNGNAIVVSLDGHKLQAGDAVLFNGVITGMSSGTINSRGIRSGTTYYVSATNLTENTFEISATKGGPSLSSSSTILINSTIYGALQTVNASISTTQTDGIQVTGLHGLVVRLTYKIQSGSTEPIQLQDQYYYIKREFPTKENIDGPTFNITSISRSSNLVTVTTSSAHRYSTGDRIVITTSDSTLNTTDASPAIITVVNSTQFRYTLNGANVSLTSGTAQARSGWTRYIKINNEIISYDYYTVDGNNRYTLYGVQRGQLGTTPQTHAENSDISMAFDLWTASGPRVSNNLFNTDGSLKSNVALTYQNNWVYTREFPDWGGDNGLLYHGVGRRDSSQPSRWEIAMYGPGYFAPGVLSFVTFANQNDSSRTAGTYNNRSGTASASGAGATFNVIIANDAEKTVTVTVSNGGSNYRLGETITIPASSIGGTGSNLVLTVSFLNFGTLYAGMNFGEPGISKRLIKNPWYQQLYKENSQIKYYLEPAPVEQRSYEDLYGSFTQSLVKTKNLISGIPDDITPYYNVRSNADTILLQASRDQYFSYLSGLVKRPKYISSATTPNSNTLVFNDAIGIEVGDTVYGPGIGSEGAVIKSITGPSFFTLTSRNGVIKIGDGTYSKTSGFWSWNADAYSNVGYTTNVYASANAGNLSSYVMFGMDSNPSITTSYTGIDYAWYLAGNNAYIYENGAYIGYYGTFFTTTEFRIEYDGTNIYYLKDGSVQRTVSRALGGQLYFDSSFYNVNSRLTNVKFGQIDATSTNTQATVELRTKRILLRDIDVYKYELVFDASLGSVARISIPNSYNINQQLGATPYKYFVSEIRFDYVDPIYSSAFRTFLFESDSYSAPILKTEIDNNTGNLYIYLNNSTLLKPETKEKFDSSLYSLRSKLNIVNFEDYKLNPEQTRIGVTLSTSSKTVNVTSVTGIKQGMSVTVFNSGGITTYPGQLPANTFVASIINDTQITLNNFPTVGGFASLRFQSTETYPAGTAYTIDPLPNLNKNSRYTLDTAKPTYFTTKWTPDQNFIDLFYSPDVNDPSSSINYALNLEDPVRYYAVDSGDRFVYKISSIRLNSGSSYLSRSTTDTTFANLAVGQMVYFTNIPGGVSLSENTPYYIREVINNDIRISTTLNGSPIDISAGATLSNLNLRMRRVYNTGNNRNTLRTSLTYFDYQAQLGIVDVPSGNAFTKTVTSTGGNLGSTSIVVTNASNIESGMYIVSNASGIPNLTVVGDSYVAGSTTVPLTTTNGTPVSLTANINSQSIIFTKAAVRIYSYNNQSYETYPYIGVSYRPSAVGYPIEATGVNPEIPSASFQDQLQFTFANDTLPQELYPYAKIEVYYPTVTLAQSVASNDTIIKVNGTIPNGYPSFGNIKVGDERIFYGYRTSTYFGDCIVRFSHSAGETIGYSPYYTIKSDSNIHNGCPQNNNTKLIVMSATPSTGVGYSASASPQTIYVAGFEADKDSTNTISFPSTAKYSISSDKLNYAEVTVDRVNNTIIIPGGTIKSGQTLNDGDEIVLNSSFGLGSGYKVVKIINNNRLQINKPTITDTSNEYRRLFICDSEIVSGLNDYFIDTALSFNSGKGMKFVGLSGCTDFKPVKCSKIKYATATSNKYATTVTLADDIAATTYTLTGLSSYFSSGSTKSSSVKSVLSFDGEDYEIKSISGRTVTLVQPLKQRIRFRDSVTIKSETYQPEFERVAGVKGLIYGPQKAVFYDRYRAAVVSVTSLGYNSSVNRFRWRLTFTRGIPSSIALFDRISSILNYNDYYVTCLPNSSELGTTTSATQIIVSAGTSTAPTSGSNQNIIYISKSNGYVARDFESASMQIGGFKNASRQQIVGTQVLAEATDGAIADIEAVSTRATRDIFTSSIGEVMGRFLFKQKNFSSSNRPNLWRNTITPPTGMNVKTGNMVSYLINDVPTFLTHQVGGDKIFYGNSSTWNAYTATGTVINNIGFDSVNSRLLFACSSNKIRYASAATPASQTEVTITGSGTNTYITYTDGYYFVANSSGNLYYSSSIAGSWFTITTGNTSPVVSVYYDEFKFIVSHEKIQGSGTVYKNYIFPSVTGSNMNISSSNDKIQGITNIFSGEKTISSTYGLGKIVEAAYDTFDGTTYGSPITEIFEYENYSDFTADDISGDFETKGVSFNYGQFFAFGKQSSTNKQFIKYSSNARKWTLVDTENLISVTDEITSVMYGGFNTYVAIVWNSSTSSNKILVSNVRPISSTNLLPSDLEESGRYRRIEESESVSLYKYKTTVTSQEGNLLLWNSQVSNLVWLKNLFGSPIKSNEFTDYKALAVENFVVYTKNSRLLPNFRSTNDSNGASRPVTIYNEKLPLGSATIATAGSGYQYGTYVNVQVLNGTSPDYGSDTNRATATVVVDETGKVIAATVDTEGNYYPTNTSLLLVNGTGSLDGSPSTSLNSTRTVVKSGITFTTTSLTSYTKTATWSANATSVTLSNLTGITIVPGQEVTGTNIPAGTFVSSAYNPGNTVVPLVNASGSSVTLSIAGSNVSLTFKLNYITIPAGESATGLVRGMTVTGGTLQTGTVILSNYNASELSGPVDIPISKTPASNFTNQGLTFSITGTQSSITTAQTRLDSITFSLNGITDTSTGYCVLYRNILNGIEFIALFFNSDGVLIDSISNLSASDLLHLSRTELFAQAL